LEIIEMSEEKKGRGRPPKPSLAGKEGNITLYGPSGMVSKPINIIDYDNGILTYKESSMDIITHTSLDFVFEET